jgi:tetratricopeptide (TPR) repeat protein
LFADLRGTGPAPVTPSDALRNFLRALGVGDTAIPADEDSRSALFRSTLSGRQVLMVLDNAASAGQVRPLLPASARCGVIVTSRRRMTDLAGSVAVEADVLPAPEAVAFLTNMAGKRDEGDGAAFAALASTCGYLPLALRIAGARLAARPAWTVRDLTTRLVADRRLLDELSVGDLAVRATFSLSYQLLEPLPARAFRLLSIADLDDIPDFAAAALLGSSIAEASALAEALVDVNLLTSPGAGRYAYHDLVRVFAREVAAQLDKPADQETAQRRLLSEYRRLATGTATEAWLEAERRNIVALLIQAATAWDDGSDVCAEILAAVQRHLRAAGYWDEWRRASEAVLRSAIRGADRGSELTAQQNLGQLAILSGDTQDAATRLSRALVLARETGDRPAEAYVLNRVGLLQFVSDPGSALASHRAALRIFEELQDQRGICTALVNIGKCQLEARQPEFALETLRRSLDIAVGLPDRQYVTYSLHHMARAYGLLGDHEGALDMHLKCLTVIRESGDREGEAYTLAEMGRISMAAGQPDRALASLTAAIGLFGALGARHPEATFLVDVGRAHLALGNEVAAITAWRDSLAVLDSADPPLAAKVRQLIQVSAVSS